MGKIYINTDSVYSLKSNMNSKGNSCKNCSSRVYTIKNNIDWKVLSRSRINTRLNNLKKRIDRQSDLLYAYSRVLGTVNNDLSDTDKRLRNDAKKITCRMSRISRVATVTQTGSARSKKNWGLDQENYSFITSLFGGGLSGAALSTKAFGNIMADIGVNAGYIMGGIGGLTEKFNENLSNEFALTSGLLAYVGAASKTFLGKCESCYDAAANWFTLVKGSGKLETGIYNYFIKGLKGAEAYKLYNRYNNFILGIGVIGSTSGVVAQSLKTVETLKSKDNSISEKYAACVDLCGSAAETIGDTYVVSKFRKKIIDSSKNKLVAANPTGLKTGGAIVNVVTSIFDAGSSGIKKYGQVTTDGNFTLYDAGVVGMSAGINGLVSVIPGGSAVESVVEFVTDKNADSLADAITNEFDEIGIESKKWVNDHQIVGEYLRDESKNKFTRSVVANAIVVNTTYTHTKNTVSNYMKKISSFI